MQDEYAKLDAIEKSVIARLRAMLEDAVDTFERNTFGLGRSERMYRSICDNIDRAYKTGDVLTYAEVQKLKARLAHARAMSM